MTRSIDPGLDIDLGRDKRISAFAIATGVGQPFGFEIMASTDLRSWQKVLTANTDGTTRERVIYDIDVTSARYVRLIGHGDAASHLTSVTEFEIYGSN